MPFFKGKLHSRNSLLKLNECRETVLYDKDKWLIVFLKCGLCSVLINSTTIYINVVESTSGSVKCINNVRAEMKPKNCLIVVLLYHGY